MLVRAILQANNMTNPGTVRCPDTITYARYRKSDARDKKKDIEIREYLGSRGVYKIDLDERE